MRASLPYRWQHGPESDHEQFLKVRDGSNTRIGVVGVGGIADSGEIGSHEVDKHAVVADFEQGLAVDLEHGCSSAMVPSLIRRLVSTGLRLMTVAGQRGEEDLPKPIWNNTLTPIARTQSTIRKAKMRGIELMYKLKNHLHWSVSLTILC